MLVLSGFTKATTQKVRLDKTLVAIAVQSPSDRLQNGFIDGLGAAQVSLSLVFHPIRQMAGARLSVHGLALGGQSKTLLGAFVSFLLGHGYIWGRIGVDGIHGSGSLPERESHIVEDIFPL
jgi:hypothetical protein